MEPEPQTKHPLAAVHPRAFRLCRFTTKVIIKAAPVALVSGALMFLAAFATGQYSPQSPVVTTFGVVALVAGTVFIPAVAVLILAICVRLITVLLFFVRYSLAHLLGAVLSLGALLTAAAVLPDWAVPCSFLGLGLWGFAVYVYIVAQDPEDPVLTPSFLRKAVQEHREKQRRKEES